MANNKIIHTFGLIFILTWYFFITPYIDATQVQGVTNTKFGMFYLLWHCPEVLSNNINDTTEILAGRAPWGPIPSFHYWGKPQLGYYCLSQNETVLRQHAAQLHDMGVNFIFVDSTNNDILTPNAQARILSPFTKLLQVWSTIPTAPKVVVWAPVTAGGNMMESLLSELDQYPNLKFTYQGKPLLMVTDNYAYTGLFPVDEAKLSQLSSAYTIRKAWGLYRTSSDIPPNHWTWLMRCVAGFLEASGNIPCNQISASFNGSIEQLSVAPGYQDTYASYLATAVPKFGGKTLQKQFQTVFSHPGIPIVLIDGWNEFMAQRFCLDAGGNATAANCTTANDHWPDGNKIFVDSFNVDYNRDIEPSENFHGNIYADITKACIGLYKQGSVCDAGNATNLCCSLPTAIHGNVERYRCDNTAWNVAGWATDDRNHSRKLTVNVDVYPDNEPYNKVTVTSLASGPREDLLGVCPNDGACSFGAQILSLPQSFLNKKLRAHAYGVAPDIQNEIQYDGGNNLFGPCNNLVSTIPLAGDLNGDRTVNIQDVLTFISRLNAGQTATIFTYTNVVADYGKTY